MKVMATLHIGTAGWNYKEWVGNFYAAGMSDSKAMLEEYARHFDSVELDTTFYGVPRATTISDWRERTPANFHFAAKFPRTITHERRLYAAAVPTAEFLDAIGGLGAKLGPLVLQFPYSFKPTAENYAALEEYLAALPTTLAEQPSVPYRYAVEVRHKGWLDERLYRVLRFHNVALALTSSDTPWLPRYSEVATADFVYIRWLGAVDKLIVERERSEDLQGWAAIAQKHLTEGRDVWGYFNNQWAGYAPGSADAFIKLVNQ